MSWKKIFHEVRRAQLEQGCEPQSLTAPLNKSEPQHGFVVWGCRSWSELQRDKSLERFRTEYEKLFKAVRKSHGMSQLPAFASYEQNLAWEHQHAEVNAQHAEVND